jgi:hypothetical protein
MLELLSGSGQLLPSPRPGLRQGLRGAAAWWPWTEVTPFWPGPKANSRTHQLLNIFLFLAVLGFELGASHLLVLPLEPQPQSFLLWQFSAKGLALCSSQPGLQFFNFILRAGMTDVSVNAHLLVEMGSPELFAQVGLQPQSFQSQPSRYLGLQACVLCLALKCISF